MEVPATRYARSGDVNIAYQVIGDGPPEYPDRVSGLVLWGSGVKGVRSEDFPWAPSYDDAIRAAEVAATRWGSRDYCDEVLREALPSVAADEDSHAGGRPTCASARARRRRRPCCA